MGDSSITCSSSSPLDLLVALVESQHAVYAHTNNEQILGLRRVTVFMWKIRSLTYIKPEVVASFGCVCLMLASTKNLSERE